MNIIFSFFANMIIYSKGIKNRIIRTILKVKFQKIENNSIIAADSIVVKDFPPFSLRAGNPARIIKKIYETS